MALGGKLLLQQHSPKWVCARGFCHRLGPFQASHNFWYTEIHPCAADSKGKFEVLREGSKIRPCKEPGPACAYGPTTEAPGGLVKNDGCLLLAQRPGENSKPRDRIYFQFSSLLHQLLIA